MKYILLIYILILLLIMKYNNIILSKLFLYDINSINVDKNHTINNSKYFYRVNNISLKLPNFIELKILRNIKISDYPEVIVAVLSAPNNFKKRFSFRYVSNIFCNIRIKCRSIFFIGCNDVNEKLLNKEIHNFNDIVVFAFHNSYYNLTLLSVMAMKYSYRFFKNIKYYIKTDDDILINYPVLFRILNRVKSNETKIYGHFDNRFKVVRNIKSKSYIPYSEYPYEYGPEYVWGALVIITYSSLKRIYRLTLHEQRYIWKEDVNLGMLCRKSNVSVLQFPFNIDLIIKRNSCIIRNNIIAVEIDNSVDAIFCLDFY